MDILASIIRDIIGEGGKFGEMSSGDLPGIVAGWVGKEFDLGVIRPKCNIHGKEELVYIRDIEDLTKIITKFLSL